MNTFTANIVILSTEISEQTIAGDAITTSGISLKYAVVNNDVNQSIFLPESQLVVSGTIRIHSQVATMGVRILQILGVISVPAAPVEAPVTVLPEALVAARTETLAAPLNLNPAHLETLKLDELKAIAAELGVAATKNKRAEWIKAILAATTEPLAVAVEAEPVPF
jgi:hypothetical protein